ncbi:MAG: 16S rRNA (uracil(1498)-N(3))-methyltransferase [Oscillospiraceae bacterium]|nr:16S rRNA (uracil(1498)-N(3))-methyltransferase [Oscillospiraceae bacterium]
MNENSNLWWRYPRFFTSDMNLNPEDLRHAKQVLRLKSGDKVVLCEDGVDFLCELNSELVGAHINDSECIFTILEKHTNQAEPSIHLRLFQCLPKSSKFDSVVQKSVELGVSEIVPLVSRRCVSRPDEKVFSKKVERWNKIAYEAAKQCGRGRVPKISIANQKSPINIREALNEYNDAHLGIIFYECGGKKLNEILCGDDYNSKTINLIIGSEGGFEPDEVKLACENGWKVATLGNRILRTETAPIAAISIIMNLTGNI